MKFELKKFKTCFKDSNFQKSFTTYKWGVMYITYKNKVVAYDKRN